KRLFDTVVLFVPPRIWIISCLRNKMHSATKVRIKKSTAVYYISISKTTPPMKSAFHSSKCPKTTSKYTLGVKLGPMLAKLLFSIG
ncbi:hypothetical protein, partial [Porphyromonas levii]|uniref:hypothetical protein n=2 Tax=Porphyromonas levii TaxID=28114 RepID=UPI001B8B7439